MPEADNEKLEIYKLYVRMSDSLSSKRIQSGSFFITILSGIFIGYSFIIEKNVFPQYSELIQLSISIIGLSICFLWRTNVISYKTLSSAKFKVIHELEENLTFAPFKKEWELIKMENQSHKILSKTEEYTALLFMLPFIILLVTGIINHFWH